MLLYCTRKASAKKQGVMGEAVVTTEPNEACADNALCRRFEGMLRYVEMEIIARYPKPLRANAMREDRLLSTSMMVRRSFQSTNFVVTEPEFRRVKHLLEIANSRE